MHMQWLPSEAVYKGLLCTYLGTRSTNSYGIFFFFSSRPIALSIVSIRICIWVYFWILGATFLSRDPSRSKVCFFYCALIVYKLSSFLHLYKIRSSWGHPLATHFILMGKRIITYLGTTSWFFLHNVCKWVVCNTGKDCAVLMLIHRVTVMCVLPHLPLE